MTPLLKGITDAVASFDPDIVCTHRLSGYLSDFHCWESEAVRNVMMTLIDRGFTTRLFKESSTGDDNYTDFINIQCQKATALGLNPLIINYVMGCLAVALKMTDKDPAPLPDSKLEAENSVVIIPHIDLEIRMIKVKGGSFTMGATFEQGICANFDEKPPVAVTLSDFMIAETPVTQALWESVMSENPSQIQGSDLPVERITWCEAEEFCHRLAQATGHPFRLPSEAQWEYAARGGADSDFTKYAGADDDEVDAHIWHRGNSDGRTHIVGMKEPNELGIYDLSGNVTEWCADWYYNSLAHLHGLTDPEGVPTGRSKVARGGSFDSPLADCRISRRFSLNPNFRSRLIGMRLAL